MMLAKRAKFLESQGKRLPKAPFQKGYFATSVCGWLLTIHGFARIPQPQYDEVMNLGFSEMIFLFFLALLIFGPKKLPEIGRQVGRALNEFKRASDEFKAQIQTEINKIDTEEGAHVILPPSSEPIGAIASGSLPPAETSPTSTELSSQAHDA